MFKVEYDLYVTLIVSTYEFLLKLSEIAFRNLSFKKMREKSKNIVQNSIWIWLMSDKMKPILS